MTQQQVSRTAARWPIGLVVAVCAQLVWADSPKDITAGEVALSPPICADVQGIEATRWEQFVRESPRTGYWKNYLGDSFWDMHHYCWAIVRLHRMRSQGLTGRHKEHAVRTAVSDFNYVLLRAKPDFVLAPEIYYRMGDALTLIGDWFPAIELFVKSREIKPDYWPSYAGHADVLTKLGKTAEAKALLERGLELAPGTEALQSRLDKLKTTGADAAGKPRAKLGPKP